MTGKIVKDNGEVEIIDAEKASCHKEVNMIDKDLKNIDLLNKYYPNAKSLLFGVQSSISFKKKVTFKRTKQSVTYQIGAKSLRQLLIFKDS